MFEIQHLLDKIQRDESLIIRAEQYMIEHEADWQPAVASGFKDLLERKKERLSFEKYRLKWLGWNVATDRDPEGLDI